MARPRLLLVPEFTELAWAIRPLLEDWADVLSYDPPGVGDESLPTGLDHVGQLTRRAVIERGLEKLDEAGWDRFFLVADAWAIATTVGIATRRTGAVAGIALGHAALSFARVGERAPINADVYDAFTQLIKQDAPAFLRHGIAQVTRGGVDEELAERIVERVPSDFMLDGWRAWTADEAFGEELVRLECPLLLAKHEGCLLYTDEGFEDAIAALPQAEAGAFAEPPSGSPAFAQALKTFCESRWS